MAKKRSTGRSKKESEQHRKNARNALFEGGSLDGKKWWIVYPCPKRILMNMGRDPYYLREGSMNPPVYEYDLNRYEKEKRLEGEWQYSV
jgi:hypothetical protein